MELHPIMYVPDQYAERDFYELFGFQRHYEGDEFPGFLAVRNGSAIVGLQRASDPHPGYAGGLRWQFEVDRVEEIAHIISVCAANDLTYEVIVEEGGERFRNHSVQVRSPAGVEVWFEGPNEVHEQGTPARLTGISPIFPVNDLPAALTHYQGLGFHVAPYADGDLYGFAERDDITVHLTYRPTSHYPEDGVAVAYLVVDDADALFGEWTQPGIGGSTEPPADMPWGMHEGVHTDPDRNVIRFGSSTR